MRPKIGDPALLEGFRMPRGTALRSVVPRGEQTACEFRTAHDLTPPVLLAVLAVLLWEIVALGRQWRQLARPVAAE